MEMVSSQPAQSKILHLLLVEDNPADAYFVKSAFQDAGVRCNWQVIDHGSKAIELTRSSASDPRPDLILLDWQLPGASGLEVLSSLKRNPDWSSAPVIMLTGMQSQSHREAAKQAGACACLEKPMDLDHWMAIPSIVERNLAAAA